MALSNKQLNRIKSKIVELALQSGFQDTKVSDCNTGEYFERFKQWVSDKYHGEMSFLERNQELRQNPEKLHPGTVRVISFRYNYLPDNPQFAQTLKDPQRANISRYALGRDYHKTLRKKLSSLCLELQTQIEDDFNLDHRVFVDSAPVLETAYAEKSGIGWKGKHTLIINKDAGSWFFLAEVFINIPLAVDEPVKSQCGNCTACLNLCPTGAIVADNKVDATKCISYLTIENKGDIPLELRPLLGNHIYGCDDCQLACPWNRFSSNTLDQDFSPRHSLDNVSLLSLWEWTEDEFLNRFQGSPIRRIGYQNWLRNLAVAIGNSEFEARTIKLLTEKKQFVNAMVKTHIDWAIDQMNQKGKPNNSLNFENQKKSKLINCITSMLPRDA
jgi:epoxyqueuosine reductase